MVPYKFSLLFFPPFSPFSFIDLMHFPHLLSHSIHLPFHPLSIPPNKQIISVLFSPLHPLALLPLGRRSGLVVDVGYTETSAVAVVNNTALMFTWRSVPVGGKAIQQ